MKRLLLIAILALTAGCGGRQDSGKFRLSFWQFWTSPDVKPTVESLIANYEMMHPGVDVDLVDLTWSDGHEKLVVAFSTGSAPDVIELGSDWIGELALKGVLADVTSFHDSAGYQLLMWEPALVEGKIYAVPWLLGTRVLFCNRDLMSRSGIDPAALPVTLADLLDYSRRISALGHPFYGFGSNSAERHRLYKKFLPFLWNMGGDILSSDGSASLLDRDEAVAALEYYVALSDAGYMETQRGLEDKFLAGEIGFIISGDWLLRRIARESPRFNVGTALIPTPDSGDVSISFAGGEYLAINRDSKRLHEAMEFISYLVSEGPNHDFCTAAGSVTPASIGASERIRSQADTLSEVFLRQIKSARASPVHPRWVYIEEILEKAIEAALYHKADPKSAMTRASNEINRLLAKRSSP